MILLATFLSPWFRWDTNALSDIGVQKEAWLFNSAVVIGGVLTLVFAFGLFTNLNQKRLTRAGIVSIMIASICLGLVGIFTEDTLIIHSIIAVGYFILLPLGFLLVGLAAEDNKIRSLSLVCGIAALFAIVLLPIVIFTLSIKIGFAVPELTESLIISIGTILLSTTVLLR
jgi:hypothetical membrane protein